MSIDEVEKHLLGAFTIESRNTYRKMFQDAKNDQEGRSAVQSMAGLACTRFGCSTKTAHAAARRILKEPLERELSMAQPKKKFRSQRLLEETKDPREYVFYRDVYPLLDELYKRCHAAGIEVNPRCDYGVDTLEYLGSMSQEQMETGKKFCEAELAKRDAAKPSPGS